MLVKVFMSAAIFLGAATAAQAQAASAPLVVTATVVSSCNVKVQGHVERSALSKMPVGIECVRRIGRQDDAPRIQRPAPHRAAEPALLVINF